MAMRRILKISISGLILFGVVICAETAQAFDNKFTHPNMTGQALTVLIQNASMDDYLKMDLGFSKGQNTRINSFDTEIPEEDRTMTIRKWFQYGSKMEDIPLYRTLSHFHNPLKDWSVSYSDDPNWFRDKYIEAHLDYVHSTPVWATGYLVPSPENIRKETVNDFDWDSARSAFFLALTGESAQTREQNWYKTFRSLGQTVHLLQDMAVPAHVRNDSRSHWELLGMNDLVRIGDRFEIYVKEHDNDIFRQLRALDPIDPLNYNLTRFWDNNQYDGSDIQVSRVPGIGLAEYANANFFSDNTIFTEEALGLAYRFPHPRKSETTASLVETSAKDGVLDRVWYVQYSPQYGLENDPSFQLAAYSFLLKSAQNF